MSTYCDSAALDQYIGQLPMASGLNKGSFITDAAAKMHAKAVGIYKVPFEILASVDPITSGVSSNILKAWNAQLAAGLLILAAAISQENETVHSYGKMLVDTTMDDLKKMKKQEIVLIGLTADTTPFDNLAKPKKALISTPDGKTTADDKKSFFNRPYGQVGDKSHEVDGGPDL